MSSMNDRALHDQLDCLHYSIARYGEIAGEDSLGVRVAGTADELSSVGGGGDGGVFG
jgi:hypothetical protein